MKQSPQKSKMHKYSPGADGEVSGGSSTGNLEAEGRRVR